MGEPEPVTELSKLLAMWVDSDLKIQTVVFFHNNPGVVESIEGLALRLGTTVHALRKEIADHIRVGLLRELPAGGMTILVYNRAKQDEVRRFVEQALHAKARQGANT